ncbi:helix-turn-helix domain-containing protein [Acinetobacter sp. Leaf130]|uniref:helix-turn-helix domain-containing protein n=1 Tax=Acinetobacter sp. Leaf130 TaxID=1736269 RepID=UPI0012DD1CFD
MFQRLLSMFKFNFQICEINRSYIRRIELGEVNLKIKNLYEISSVLDIDVKELLP